VTDKIELTEDEAYYLADLVKQDARRGAFTVSEYNFRNILREKLSDGESG
jgi:hypothetical protein